MLDFQIIPGAIHLHQVTLISDDPDLKVVEVNAASKYYSISSAASVAPGPAVFEVTLGVREYSSHLDEELVTPTVILFELDGAYGDWRIEHNTGFVNSFEIILTRVLALSATPVAV